MLAESEVRSVIFNSLPIWYLKVIAKGAVTGVCDVLFDYSDCSKHGQSIPTVFQCGGSRPKVAFWDGPSVFNGRLRLCYPPTVAIHRANTSATPGIVAENYIQFASTTVENVWNRLNKLETTEIRQANKPASPGTTPKHHFRSATGTANVEDG